MNTTPHTVRTGSLLLGIVFSSILVETAYHVELRLSPNGSQASAFIAWYFGCLLVIAPILLATISKVAAQRRDFVLDMARNEEIDSVGALVDTLDDGNDRHDQECREALIRLLPQMKGENAYLLDEYRQARLRYIVRPPASPIYSTYLTRLARNSALNVALRISIVEALSRVGDREALTMFDELLECTAYTANERRIQHAVRAARPALVARVKTEPSRQSLLRAATSPDYKTLVRIPQDEFELSPDELLHVNENETN